MWFKTWQSILQELIRWETGNISVGRPGSLGVIFKPKFMRKKDRWLKREESIRGWKGRRLWEVENSSERKDGSQWFPVDTSFHEPHLAPIIGFAFPEIGCCSLQQISPFLSYPESRLQTNKPWLREIVFHASTLSFYHKRKRAKVSHIWQTQFLLHLWRITLTISQFGALVTISLIFNDMVVFNNFYNLLNIKLYKGYQRP